MSALVRNARAQEALDAWGTTKDLPAFGRVLSRLLVGDLLLDISPSTIADPARGIQVGDTLAISSQLDDAGKRLLAAYTDNDRLAAAVDAVPKSLVQPGLAVLERALADFDGIVVDPRHPGMFIAYTDELRRGLGADPGAASRLATDLARRARPFPEFLADLQSAPLYLGVHAQRSPDGEVQAIAVPLASSADGAPVSTVFTSPADVWAWAPGVEAHETRLANVAQAALDGGHAAIVVNPNRPSITIPPSEFAGLAAGERA